MIPADAGERAGLRHWLQQEETRATCCAALLVDMYGTDWLDWDPDSLRLSLQQDLEFKPPRMTVDKCLAVQVIMTTDQLYRSPEAFVTLMQPLNLRPATFRMELPSLADAAWGLTECKLLLGEDYDPQLFSDDVCRFAGIILQSAGAMNPMPPLDFAIMPEGMPEGEDTASIFSTMLLSRNVYSVEDAAAYVRQQLADLISQLDQLPLRSRSADWINLSRKLRQLVPASA